MTMPRFARQEMKTAVTRIDVARLAGTSTAVVSYVINDGPRPVAEDTRARVLAAIAALGYRPNRVAQALRGQRSRVLGLVVPDIANPYYAELAHAIENEAARHGYSLILCNTAKDAQRELDSVRALADRQVDGFFLISGSSSVKLKALARETTIPCVMLDRHINHSGHIALIETDNIAGGKAATRHLLALGHRRVAAICGPSQLGGGRAAGYEQAMREAGLEPVLHNSQYDRDSSYDCAMRVLSAAPPSAVFAGNDLIALSVIRAAADLGLRVPGDVAVVGFDDIQEARYAVPRLTTMAHPIQRLGLEATELLVQRLTDPTATHEVVRRIVPELIVRESCGASPAASRSPPAGERRP